MKLIQTTLHISGGSGVYIGGGQWGGHNCSWGARTYIATLNHP